MATIVRNIISLLVTFKMTQTLTVREAQFPRNPEPNQLRTTYNRLRETAQRLSHARGALIGINNRKKLQIESLQAELSNYAEDATLDYQEKAQLLGILGRYRDVFASMETAGDEMVAGFQEYEFGSGPFAGGRPIARLLNACRAFILAWKAAKDLGPEIRELGQ